MKKFLLAALFFCFLFLVHNNALRAQGHKLVKLWQTDSVLKVPESVLYDGTGQILFFSNIGGAPDGKNGKGSIGKLGLDGKVVKLEWIVGLNGPKGLGRFKNTLYVADVS